jgi:hypothetical protein
VNSVSSNFCASKFLARRNQCVNNYTQCMDRMVSNYILHHHLHRRAVQASITCTRRRAFLIFPLFITIYSCNHRTQQLISSMQQRPASGHGRCSSARSLPCSRTSLLRTSSTPVRILSGTYLRRRHWRSTSIQSGASNWSGPGYTWRVCGRRVMHFSRCVWRRLCELSFLRVDKMNLMCDLALWIAHMLQPCLLR